MPVDGEAPGTAHSGSAAVRPRPPDRGAAHSSAARGLRPRPNLDVLAGRIPSPAETGEPALRPGPHRFLPFGAGPSVAAGQRSPAGPRLLRSAETRSWHGRTPNRTGFRRHTPPHPRRGAACGCDLRPLARLWAERPRDLRRPAPRPRVRRGERGGRPRNRPPGGPPTDRYSGTAPSQCRPSTSATRMNPSVPWPRPMTRRARPSTARMTPASMPWDSETSTTWAMVEAAEVTGLISPE